MYDRRTDIKTNSLQREDLDEFVACYFGQLPGSKPNAPDTPTANRHQRKPTWSEKHPEGRWRTYDYQDLIPHDKANLDIFWPKGDTLSESGNSPAPELIAAVPPGAMPHCSSEYWLTRRDPAKVNGPQSVSWRFWRLRLPARSMR